MTAPRPESASRPVICPVCGKRGETGAARCPGCGAPYDLETRRAVGGERVRYQRSVAMAILIAAMAWWLMAILGRPTIAGILLPVTLSFVAFAELTYLSIAEKRMKARHQSELRGASARATDPAAGPETADAGSPAEPAGSDMKHDGEDDPAGQPPALPPRLSADRPGGTGGCR